MQIQNKPELDVKSRWVTEFAYKMSKSMKLVCLDPIKFYFVDFTWITPNLRLNDHCGEMHASNHSE